MEANYRITFNDGPLGNKRKHFDVSAKSSDEAFQLAFMMPEAKSGIYTDVSVEEIPREPSVIGIEFQYYDTYFKQNFTDYIFIKANNETEAVDYYNKHFKDGRFQFKASKTDENGKCIRGKILNTYFAACPGYDADATVPIKKQKEFNTKISYLYRDADNYKKHNNCVIKGILTEEQKKKILDCRQEDEWFIPSQVGLPEEKFDKLDLAVDHPWFELENDCFTETNAEPTVDITAEELVVAFENCKGKWDEFSWLNGLDIELPDKISLYEVGDLDNKISDARAKKTNFSDKELRKDKEEYSL